MIIHNVGVGSVKCCNVAQKWLNWPDGLYAWDPGFYLYTHSLNIWVSCCHIDQWCSIANEEISKSLSSLFSILCSLSGLYHIIWQGVKLIIFPNSEISSESAVTSTFDNSWARREWFQKILIKLFFLSYLGKAKTQLTLFSQIQKDGSVSPQASRDQSEWFLWTLCGRIFHRETENHQCGSGSTLLWAERGPR